MKNLFRAWQFFRADFPRLAVALGLMLLATAANLLKPWPLAVVVDCVLGGHPPPAWLGSWGASGSRPTLLLGLAGLTLALHILQGALTTGQNYLAIGIGLRGLMRARNEVFGCLQRLSLRFHQGSQAGDMIYRATWDPYAFQTLFQQGLITLASSLASLALMLAIMWRMDRPLTLVAAGTAPLLLLSIRAFGREMNRRGAAAQAADGKVAALVQQAMAALPLTQSFTREEHEQAGFVRQTAAAERSRRAQHGAELAYGFGTTVVFGLGTAAIVWLGGREVIQGRLSVGELLIFLAYLGQFYDPLNQLSHVGSTMAGAGAGAQRVFEVLDAPEEVKEKPQARSVQRGVAGAVPRESAPGLAPAVKGPVRVHGALAFAGVSFGYQPDRLALREVSFTLPAARSLAVIGPSGAGKTTLLQLLPRFYDPTAGAVLLEGVDLRELRLKELRRQVALVSQEAILLPGTVAENIACGKTGATAGEIAAAARAARADEFIRLLPQGYETLIGEGAARLSAGEKQRLNLARAFLKDAPILLLDEPTSALDAENEALVMESLTELMRGRTTLLVTHRLAAIRRVDLVLVLEAGRLAEMGTPAELLARPGYFARVMSGA